jgi:hypothetical protein
VQTHVDVRAARGKLIRGAAACENGDVRLCVEIVMSSALVLLCTLAR